MVDFFINFLTYEKRSSKHTITAYRTDLLQFQGFLEGEFDTETPQTATFNEIRAWIVSLSEKGNDPRSINRKIASLRSFYAYLLKLSKIEVDPTIKVKSLKTGKKLPSFVEEKSINNLLNDSFFTHDFSGIRDLMVLELFYGAGIRLSELIGLEIKDIDSNANKITVLGKRNKYRQIPLTRGLVAKMDSYLDLRNEQFGKSGFLFLTDTGKKLYPVFVQRLVKKYLGRVTSLKQKSPHILRHTYATHLLNKGADLNAIKELLGHSSLAATQVYTHNSIDKLKEIHKKAHPKAE